MILKLRFGLELVHNKWHIVSKVYKFYHRHSELIVKYNIGLKLFCNNAPVRYGDLVYKFQRIFGKPNLSDQFKKIIQRYIKVGYNLNVMQSVCMPDFKPNHGLKLWFPLLLHNGRSGLRLFDSSDVKL